MRVALIIHWHK